MDFRHPRQMGDTVETVQVDYDPRLLEEVVLRAIRGGVEERDFRASRDRIYEEPDVEVRDQAFRAFHIAWFGRLGLGVPIERALAERTILADSVIRCVVAPACSKKEEGADLFVAPPRGDGSEQRSIGIQIRAESFLEPDAVLELLRHEFLHLADMLNPAFEYEPELPHPEGGAMARRMLQDRYRALWDITIDGRLVREGRAPVGVRDRRLNDFARAFPMLGEKTEAAFTRFFQASFPTHSELLACALAPSEILAGCVEAGSRDLRCPICNFPTYVFEPDPEALEDGVVARIIQDFSDWQPPQGICVQCADLYRALPLSEAAEKQLPRIV